MRDDALSYEHDYREKHGPYRVVEATAESPFFPWFVVGFCPVCGTRLSWARTLCFEDEAENQCYECLTVWT